MSFARPIFNNVTLMLTRRVRNQEFRLKPTHATNAIVRYVVAVAQQKWEIEIHALVVMSNHWHVVLTDPSGNIVEFQRDCHQFIARAINAYHGEFENLWATAPTSRVECEGPNDVIERIVYVMANPVQAHLVSHGHHWPGVRHAWPGKPVRCPRPPKFFRGPEMGGCWPAEALLTFSRPPGYDHLSHDQLTAMINERIEERETAIRKRASVRKRFLTRSGVLKQHRCDRPRSRAPRFRQSPTLACRDESARVARLEAKRIWISAYRIALARWRAGDRNVLFPPGTYRMRVVHNARCAMRNALGPP